MGAIATIALIVKRHEGIVHSSVININNNSPNGDEFIEPGGQIAEGGGKRCKFLHRGNNGNRTETEQIHSLPHMWRSGIVPRCDIYRPRLKSA